MVTVSETSARFATRVLERAHDLANRYLVGALEGEAGYFLSWCQASEETFDIVLEEFHRSRPDKEEPGQAGKGKPMQLGDLDSCTSRALVDLWHTVFGSRARYPDGCSLAYVLRVVAKGIEESGRDASNNPGRTVGDHCSEDHWRDMAFGLLEVMRRRAGAEEGRTECGPTQRHTNSPSNRRGNDRQDARATGAELGTVADHGQDARAPEETGDA